MEEEIDGEITKGRKRRNEGIAGRRENGGKNGGE